MTIDTSNVAFLDLESTGLGPDCEIWDLAFIIDNVEYQWFFKPTRWEAAEPMGLKIGCYYERTQNLQFPGGIPSTAGFDPSIWSDPYACAPRIACLLDGRHIVGAVPSFDERLLRRFLIEHGAQLTTHYHLVCVENLVAGVAQVLPPWKSSELSEAMGAPMSSDEDRHTAIGDARWARDLFLKVFEK